MTITPFINDRTEIRGDWRLLVTTDMVLHGTARIPPKFGSVSHVWSRSRKEPWRKPRRGFVHWSPMEFSGLWIYNLIT